MFAFAGGSMSDDISRDTISYQYLLSILRKRQPTYASQSERDYFHTLWHDLLVLDAEVRKEVSERRSERGN
jgi:hypothetical protein